GDRTTGRLDRFDQRGALIGRRQLVVDLESAYCGFYRHSASRLWLCGRLSAFTEPLRGLYFTLSLLLTRSKLYGILGPVSSPPPPDRMCGFSTRSTPKGTSLVHSPIVAPFSRTLQGGMNGRAKPHRRGRSGAGQGARCSLHPPLVHRRARSAEELFGQ